MTRGKLAVAAVLGWFSLSAGMCATGGDAPPPIQPTVVCPVRPIPYTLADERALRTEFDALADTSQLKRWIRDYIAERAALKACVTKAVIP